MISRQARTPERSDDPLSRIAPLISWSVQHLDHLDDARALYDARVAADAIHRIRHDAPRGVPSRGNRACHCLRSEAALLDPRIAEEASHAVRPLDLQITRSLTPAKRPRRQHQAVRRTAGSGLIPSAMCP